jgi:hypothetical protein
MNYCKKPTSPQKESEKPLSQKVEALHIWRASALLFLGVLVTTQAFGIQILNSSPAPQNSSLEQSDAALKDAVVPLGGLQLPIQWGDFGSQMVSSGVIDRAKFENVYAQRAGLDADMQQLLDGSGNNEITITEENAPVLLNLLWAFGLANQNVILEEGPMVSEQYGADASRFASTGGWTLARGSVMDHYSQHHFVSLTSEQQNMVERVARGIYRPCCGNSTYLPDCNHGMAMLGLLELMAANGVSEPDMYRVALGVNAYWFPSTYITIAKYFAARGVAWNDVDAKEVLGSAYSSAQGYGQILAEVEPVKSQGGGSCGV